MASTDIRQFLFYFKYLWSPADFTNLQLWLQETTAGIAEGAFGVGVLDGLSVAPAGGLQVTVNPGIALGDNAELMVLGSPANLTFSADPIQTKKSLIVMRPTLVNMDIIPEPNNPANNVPLDQQITFDLLIIDGTPGGDYPSKISGDCVVMGVIITPSLVTIGSSNLDRTPIELPRKRVHPYSSKSASYNAVITDDHLDVDATGGARTILLPLASTMPGQDMTIVKTDSSANAVAVSGQDLISGQTVIYLDSQWQFAHVRSTGQAWRSL